jgi:hypothetical protein
MSEQEKKNRAVATARSHVECRRTLAIPNMDVGASVQEGNHGSWVPTHCGQHQWCLPFRVDDVQSDTCLYPAGGTGVQSVVSDMSSDTTMHNEGASARDRSTHSCRRDDKTPVPDARKMSADPVGISDRCHPCNLSARAICPAFRAAISGVSPAAFGTVNRAPLCNSLWSE